MGLLAPSSEIEGETTDRGIRAWRTLSATKMSLKSTRKSFDQEWRTWISSSATCKMRGQVFQNMGRRDQRLGDPHHGDQSHR
jgi:hypothetical protein